VSELSLTGKKRPVAGKAGDIDQLILDDDEFALLDGGEEEMVGDGLQKDEGEDEDEDIAVIMAKSKATSKVTKNKAHGSSKVTNNVMKSKGTSSSSSSSSRAKK